MAQGNICPRHEAFSELYNLSQTRKEDFTVPEIAIVGEVPYACGLGPC